MWETRKITWYPLGIVLGLVLLIGSIVLIDTKLSSASANFTNTFSNTANSAGKVGSTLVTPEGATFSLVKTERHGTQMLFHIKLHNNQSQTVAVWNSDPSHGFVFYNHVTNTFETGGTVPSFADLGMHPVLGRTVAGQANSDGWITFNLSAQYDPTLFYYYRVIHAKRCPPISSPTTSGPAPVDFAKCEPAILYSTIHWDV